MERPQKRVRSFWGLACSKSRLSSGMAPCSCDVLLAAAHCSSVLCLHWLLLVLPMCWCCLGACF